QDEALPYRGGTQPMSEPFRRRGGLRSAAGLARGSRLPGWGAMVGGGGVTGGGAVGPGAAGAALLAGPAVLLAALAAFGWPALTPPARLARVLVLALVLAGAIRQYTLS